MMSTPLQCEQVHSLLFDADPRKDPPQEASSHLARCVACREIWQDLQAVGSWAAEEKLRNQPARPAALERLVVDRLRQQNGDSAGSWWISLIYGKAGSTGRLKLLGYPVAVAAALVLMVAYAALHARPQAPAGRAGAVRSTGPKVAQHLPVRETGLAELGQAVRRQLEGFRRSLLVEAVHARLAQGPDTTLPGADLGRAIGKELDGRTRAAVLALGPASARGGASIATLSAAFGIEDHSARDAPTALAFLDSLQPDLSRPSAAQSLGIATILGPDANEGD